ncbi:MAG: signal peptidase I [Clostridia bacterium]|nr:signal peptidase I [Clostridia bacterium]
MSEVQKKSVSREILEWLGCIVAAFVVALIIKYFIFTPTLVKQGSMTPTILDGERVIINRLVRTFHGDINRGDIVTLEKPSSILEDEQIAVYSEVKGLKNKFLYYVLELTKTSYIKRVIGMPGDHLYISDGKVYINDEVLDEPYLEEGLQTPRKGMFYDVVVPEGYVFVMGDNRTGSSDSREFGCVPLDKIEGRVSFRIWPLSKFGKVD